jgi:hypothetical protein
MNNIKNESEFILNMSLKKEIQNYLERKFAGGIVHLSENASATHLFGVWGLCIKGKNVLHPKKLTRKSVVKCSISDDSVLQVWDSLSIAYKEENFPTSTLSAHIRFKKLFEESYYYKYYFVTPTLPSVPLVPSVPSVPSVPLVPSVPSCGSLCSSCV